MSTARPAAVRHGYYIQPLGLFSSRGGAAPLCVFCSSVHFYVCRHCRPAAVRHGDIQPLGFLPWGVSRVPVFSPSFCQQQQKLSVRLSEAIWTISVRGAPAPVFNQLLLPLLWPAGISPKINSAAHPRIFSQYDVLYKFTQIQKPILGRCVSPLSPKIFACVYNICAPCLLTSQIELFLYIERKLFRSL
jgi:hypothetical protein